ncbi:EAL domain-containing protein [Paenibacillus psychroresistens]|uniref:EAL domain-containing protein n=1 Tax=Paenibacillus psychroresistens TaxID=1778678 RepID=A0A6B8RU30_9BACL|nr:EAL domain-containing protein [Paenibacillus psychroresistens]QGQ99095.1 EAL domain-containing protein [Paenibacillus psychroresistens]
MRNKMNLSFERTIQSNEQTNRLIMESFSQFLKMEEDLAIVFEELQKTIRQHNSMILKYKKVDDQFIYTFCEGILLQRYWIETTDIPGKSLDELFPEELANYMLPYYEHAWKLPGLISFEMKWRGIQLLTLLRPIFRDGQITGVISVSFDNTLQVNMKEKMSYLTDYDHLTRLPNRTFLNKRLQEFIEQKSPAQFAVFAMNIDHFRQINDTLGHDIGDRLLQVVARRLKTCVKDEQYFVSRIGGNEFICLIPKINDMEMNSSVEQIINSIKQPIRMSGQDLFIKVSVGISEYPESGNDSEKLFKYADTAMFAAKVNGRNQFKYWDAQLNDQFHRRILIEKHLKKAIENNEFTLYYQPQINQLTSKIIGLESLIRWENPELGFVMPGEFIPIAEESDLIIDIGNWVLREACHFNKQLQLDGVPPLRIAVNLSTKQFLDPALKDNIKMILEESQLDPQYLELEITESMTIEVEISIRTLRSLKKLGLSIAMDDFGTGYSSLSNLKEFPIDILKIDQSFVNGMTSSLVNSSIVKTIIAMSKSLDLDVIAEGVEDKETLKMLNEYGCSIVQGYYFSRPIAANKVREAYYEIMSKHFSEGLQG